MRKYQHVMCEIEKATSDYIQSLLAPCLKSQIHVRTTLVAPDVSGDQPIEDDLSRMGIMLNALQGRDETTTFLHSFWQRLIDRANGARKGHLARKSASRDWLLYSEAGIPHCRFIYRIWPDGRTGVEFEIRTDDQNDNKTIYDRLYADKDRIEEQCGHELW